MRKLSMYVPKSLIVSDRLRIYYEVSPLEQKAPWLFFIHGLGGDVTGWDEEREKFASLGYATAAIDLRGHGLSERAKNEDSYAMDKFVSDVLEVIKAENLENITIIGHCLGGVVALTTQALFPDTSKALTLVDTTYKPSTTSTLIMDHKLISKLFRTFAKYAPDIGYKTHEDPEKYIGSQDLDVSRFLSDLLHTSIRSYLLIYDKFMDFDATTLLKKISVPTLVIHGTNDSVFPPSVAQELYKNIQNADLAIIDNANHIIVLNNPDELVSTIQKFLQKIALTD